MAAKSNSKPAGKNTKETEKKKLASSTKSSATKATKASAAKPTPAKRAAATKDTSKASAGVRGGASKAGAKSAPRAESIPGGTTPSKESKSTKSIAPTRGSKADDAQKGSVAAQAPAPKAAAAASAAAGASKKPAKGATREIYSAATGTASSSPFPSRELEKFRGLINDLRVENQDELEVLTGQLREMTSSETGDDNSAYSMHMAEQGTDAMEHEKTFLQAQRTSDYIKKLEEALERIDSGTFGLCRVCGLRIDSKRLMAVPVTQVCTVYKNTSKPCEPGKIHMQQTGVTEEDLPK
jgi:RNA polymerase-binding transcription factor DksA